MAISEEPTQQTSSYLNYLPSIFQEDTESGRPIKLGRFLLAFEKILTGLQDVDEPGLEEILDGISSSEPGKPGLRGVERYFDPGPDCSDEHRAPAEFLEWLSSWVALSLQTDLDEACQRDFIARAVSLYRLRGTKKGLEEVMAIYTRHLMELVLVVDEMNTSFQIGVHSRIGEDTLINGGAPHFFRVLLRLFTPSPELMRRHRMLISAIVDTEKPAHTYYRVDTETPATQIGVSSTVGVDTLLGTRVSQ